MLGNKQGATIGAYWSPASDRSTAATETAGHQDDGFFSERTWDSPVEEPLLHGMRTKHVHPTCAFLCLLFATYAIGVLSGLLVPTDWHFPVGWKALGNNKLKPKFGQRQRLSILGRDVWVYQPSMTIRSQPSAAIVVLHGSEDTALNIAAATGFEDFSEQPLDETFISVFPEMGTLRAEDWDYKADIVFFKTLADTLVTNFGVKGEEVFVCGHSAGGSMALFLQNNMPNVFRAAAAVEAGVGHLPKWDLSSAGRPAMVIWNQNDPVLKEYGGEKLLSNTLSTLRRHDSSRLGPSFSLSIPLADHSSVKHAQKFMWGGGANSPPTLVISWESVQPSHHWVNGKSFPGAFDASGKIWDFFRSTRSWSSSDSGYGVEELSKNAMIQA